MENDPISPLSSCQPNSNPIQPINFFVSLTSTPGRTLQFQANSADTILSVHQKIQSSDGVPVASQCLFYNGKQLQWKQTLHQCAIQNDVVVELVHLEQSNSQSDSWKLMNDIVSSILFLLRKNPPAADYNSRSRVNTRTVESMLVEFLSKTPHKIDEAVEYLKIFTESNAIQALEMLSLSSHKPNRSVAYDSIENFILYIERLPTYIFHVFVSTMVKLCIMLREKNGKDSEYSMLCYRIGSLLEYVPNAIGMKIDFSDTFVVVSDIAASLSKELVSCAASNSVLGPRCVKDFSAFLGPIRREIKGNGDLSIPIKIPLSDEHNHKVEIVRLLGIFVDLLSKVEQCLEKIEVPAKYVKDFYQNKTCQYVAILKELSLISKLYDGCEKLFWEAVKRRKGTLCYLIVRFGKNHYAECDDHRWILEIKGVANFETRKHLAMMMLSDYVDNYDCRMVINIDRAKLLESSFKRIGLGDPKIMDEGIAVEFKNEVDYGPEVLQDWFNSVCIEIFFRKRTWFVPCHYNHKRFLPNPASKLTPTDLEYFRFTGRIIALALMHEIKIGILFHSAFFKQLTGDTISLGDIREVDPKLYTTCKKILEMDPVALDKNVLGLKFVHEIEESGEKKDTELCPGGRHMVVSSKNRKLYVYYLLKHVFVEAICEQVTHFAKGFTEIMDSERLTAKSFFRCLELEDLDIMLNGNSDSEISSDDSEEDVTDGWMMRIEELEKEHKQKTVKLTNRAKRLKKMNDDKDAIIASQKEECERLKSVESEQAAEIVRLRDQLARGS